MSVRSKPGLRVWIVLSVVCLGGCANRGLETVPISGRVTFEGEPVTEGRIRFYPLEGTVGPTTGAVIQDGRYEVRNKGGVVVGEHRVKIEAHRARGQKQADPDMPGVESQGSEQFIPSKYNEKSELVITVESGSGNKTFDFELKK